MRTLRKKNRVHVVKVLVPRGQYGLIGHPVHYHVVRLVRKLDQDQKLMLKMKVNNKAVTFRTVPCGQSGQPGTIVQAHVEAGIEHDVKQRTTWMTILLILKRATQRNALKLCAQNLTRKPTTSAHLRTCMTQLVTRYA